MKTYHLFISHSWSHSDHYERLLGLLRGSPYFVFRDYSVPRNDPIHTSGTDAALRGRIRAQMASCHVVLILAGVYASYSKWIRKEIELAERGFARRKPIVAIEPWGSERTSTSVKNAAARIVKWNTASVVRAIREVG